MNVAAYSMDLRSLNETGKRNVFNLKRAWTHNMQGRSSSVE